MPTINQSPQRRARWRHVLAARVTGWLVIIAPLALLMLAAVPPVRSAALAVLLRPRTGLLATLAPEAVAWTDFAPSGWVTALPLTSSVTAQAPAGLDPATAAYATSTDAGGAWSAWTTAGLTVSGPVSTTQTLTVTGLSFPDSASANLIRFQIQEIGSGLEVSPVYIVRVDTARPTSVVTQPADGATLKAAPAIQGTAVDAGGSGPSAVSVSIRAAASGQYWTGTTWADGEQWLATSGTTVWSYTGAAPAWADGASYTVRSRASDAAGNIEAPAAGNSFTFDAIPPAVTVIAPNGGEIWAGGQTHTITWTASDAVGLAAAPIALSASYDGGVNWALIATAQSNSGSYIWAAPALDTDQALVRIEATDRAGNIGSDLSNTTFTLDSSAPGAPQGLAANPSGWTNVNNFSVSWTNPPEMAAVTGAWYKLDAPPVAANDGIFVATTNTLTGIVLPGDGAHLIYVWLQDQLGQANPAAAASTTLQLDRVPPSPPFNLQGSPKRTWTNVNQFAERWSNPADLSGVVGAYYRLNRPGSFATDGIFVAAADLIEGIAVPADGKHDLYIWLVDAAGNVDEDNRNIDPQVFWYDSTPPISAATLTPPVSASGWYSTPVTVSFAASDGVDASGVAMLYHLLDNGSWNTQPSLQLTTEGAHAIMYFAQDVAGNSEVPHSLNVNIDLTPPALALVPDRAPQATGWYTAPVTLTLQANDAPSGQAAAYYRVNGGSWQAGTPANTTIQFSTNGLYQVDAYAQDLAGNRTPIQSTAVKVDTTPPATAYLIEGTQGQNSWYTSPLTIKLIPTDATSGVATTYYRINDGVWQAGAQFQLTTDGNYVLAFYSVDAAGNIETSFPIQVKLDTAAPGAPIAVETLPDGWSRVNRFAVRWANPTDLSGVAGVHYLLNQEPTRADDGTFSPLTNRLDGVTVPSEGVHRLYLWLRDGAGNVDHRNRTLAPLLRYDATPPSTNVNLQGLAGANGWYRSPVNVTLTSTDAHSGVAQLRYRVDGGDWISTTQTSVVIALTTPDKHVLEYASEDVAGNTEPARQLTVRIDPTPPAAPSAVNAEPAGWQHVNSFRLSWRAPVDQSGVAGVYVRFGAAPTQPDDGTFYPATGVLEGLPVPAEGRHTIYVWLRDTAGNADPGTAVALTDALWYDATPPVTVVRYTGAQGGQGWYIGPVTFTLTASDTASGLAETRYQIDDGAWVTGDGFTLAEDGRHTVRVASSDSAGNVETPQTFQVAIDRTAPIARLTGLSRRQPRARFQVQWWGVDLAPGSGLAAFDVQVRDGSTGAWRDWLTGTPSIDATFEGERGHTYFFRVAVRDQAGNRQPYGSDLVYATVETVLNGHFDTGNFTDWTASGLLFKAVVPMTGPSGGNVLGARLGSEEYGPSLTAPGQVPVDSATISQTLRVPDLSQVARPTLSFWYRVFTYDVMYSERLQRYVDTFEVTLNDLTGQPRALLVRDGNPTRTYKVLYDTGWKQVLVDLHAYAGQTVQLVLANYNRHDNLFNTWSYVDDIQVGDWPYSHRVWLSMIAGGGAAQTAEFSAAPTFELAAPAEAEEER